MAPTITAFEKSPDRGRGLARDMRIRWAFEEVGQAYDVQLVSFEAMKGAGHLARNPFGQIPTYQDNDLTLFESGAIVLHIAQSHPGLLPVEANAHARAIMWMFAALNTVEPPILDLVVAKFVEASEPWAQDRMPLVEARIHKCLAQLAPCLEGETWLDGEFSAGDLMMVSVVRRLAPSGLLGQHPELAAYIARAEARPAFQRAFAAQLAVFNASQVNS